MAENTAPLGELPADLVTQRIGLHRLATYVIAPARFQHAERFGLRATPGGFGTPAFGESTRVRVAHDQLVVEEGAESRIGPITSLRAAAAFIGSKIDLETAAEHDSPPPGDLDADLGIDAAVVRALAAWWALGTEALQAVSEDELSIDPSEVQLWPGHFDAAAEIGDEDHRASYGASPGDATSDEPYLYVSVWWPDRLSLDTDDDYWNADGFVGSRMPYTQIREAHDPFAAATEFYRAGRDRLGPPS